MVAELAGPTEDIFKGFGIEILLREPDDFLKVKETLTRIGIPSKKEQILYQSCHILHKRGRYVICHFKELFALDGKPTSISESDLARRNTITKLLNEWDLVGLVRPIGEDQPLAPINQVKIISFKDKANWKLVSKYSIGKKKLPTEI